MICIDIRAPAEETDRLGIWKSYFLKLLPNKEGRDIVRGEYNSLHAIYDIAPDFVPTLRAWGSLSQDPNLHFLLCDFHELDSQLLSVDRFAAALGELHTKSAGCSREFGFPLPTHIGRVAQHNHWKETWEEWFTSNFDRLLKLERESCDAPDFEFSILSSAMFLKVIPCLLRPMESFGRRIVPALLHGDITSANASTSLSTNGPIIYDTCCVHGHNEYDLRHFRNGDLGIEYMEAYQKIVPISETKEDFEDRMKLYRLMSLLQTVCVQSGYLGARGLVKANMRHLVKRYPGGLQDYLNRQEAMRSVSLRTEGDDKPKTSVAKTVK